MSRCRSLALRSVMMLPCAYAVHAGNFPEHPGDLGAHEGSAVADERALEGQRRLLATRWPPCESQGPVILQAVPRGIESVPRPVLRNLDCDVVQVARGVGVVGDEGGDILRNTPQDRQDDFLHTFRRREGVEAPVAQCRLAQPVSVLQGELPIRLQLGSQVGDGVRRRYPVPWVFQLGAEA